MSGSIMQVSRPQYKALVELKLNSLETRVRESNPRRRRNPIGLHPYSHRGVQSYTRAVSVSSHLSKHSIARRGLPQITDTAVDPVGETVT